MLFVEHNGSQFVPLVGIQHGRFKIQKDQTGADMLVTGEEQPLTDVSQLGVDEKTVARNKRALSLQDFKTGIQTRIRQLRAAGKIP